MVNTWNTAELNEKVNNLNAKVNQIDAKTLPDTSEATTGQILGLTGEDKTPDWVDASGGSGLPDYSTTEVATGQKWIDGKELYQKTIVYDLSESGLQSGKVIETGVNDADFMFIDKHVFILPTGSVSGFFTGENVDGYDLILFITRDFKIKSSSGSNNFDSGAGRMLYVTIKYTKATPTPTRKTKK